MQITGAEIIVRTLIRHGVNAVFGYPGGSVLNLYDSLYQHRDELMHYITCHEQGATHAADGYARATGKPGVVIATSGPGATNLVTGLATAYLDSTPIVAITGNVPLALIGTDGFQEVDIAGITMPITKHNYIVKNIAELEGILCEAFQIARSGRPGPVLVDVPKNIQIALHEYAEMPPLPLEPMPPIDTAELDAALSLLRHCERPLIYAGGGVILSDSCKELLDFAEQIDAPIVASMMGLSAVSARHPRMLGMTGMHGCCEASRATAAADLIIGIGVRFSDRATGNKDHYQKDRAILHIDIDRAEQGKNITQYTALGGNMKELLPLLTENTPHRPHPAWQAQVAKYKAESPPAVTTGLGLAPRDVIRLVRNYTAEDTIVATDVGQHQIWVAQYYPFTCPRTFLTSGGLGTMGFGMGAAIGGSIAQGHKKTVLFTGDGSFHMNLNELATAVTHKIPLVILVMNNHVLGMVRQWQRQFFEERFSQTTLNRQTDYVKLAESFGAKGYRAADINELEHAVKQAFLSEEPVVIDCLIHKDERVLPMIPPNGTIQDMILE